MLLSEIIYIYNHANAIRNGTSHAATVSNQHFFHRPINPQCSKNQKRPFGGNFETECGYMYCVSRSIVHPNQIFKRVQYYPLAAILSFISVFFTNTIL